MKRGKLPSLGTVFMVPLRDRGFVVGVLTRADGKGACFGYFFGPRISCANEVDFQDLAPEHALLVGMFGDLEILRGNWPLLGEIKNWSPERWPVPPLSRLNEKTGSATLSRYDDTLQCVSEKEISPAEASRYPYDRLMGAGATEIRLTKLIKEANGKS